MSEAAEGRGISPRRAGVDPRLQPPRPPRSDGLMASRRSANDPLLLAVVLGGLLRPSRTVAALVALTGNRCDTNVHLSQKCSHKLCRNDTEMTCISCPFNIDSVALAAKSGTRKYAHASMKLTPVEVWLQRKRVVHLLPRRPARDVHTSPAAASNAAALALELNWKQIYMYMSVKTAVANYVRMIRK